MVKTREYDGVTQKHDGEPRRYDGANTQVRTRERTIVKTLTVVLTFHHRGFAFSPSTFHDFTFVVFNIWYYHKYAWMALTGHRKISIKKCSNRIFCLELLNIRYNSQTFLCPVIRFIVHADKLNSCTRWNPARIWTNGFTHLNIPNTAN